MKITIIGAGIGGLTTAIALHKKGFEVEVFESFAEFKPLGSGINLAINAMQVYKQLGIFEIILSNANPLTGMNVVDSQFGPLSRMTLEPFEQQYAVTNAAIHRSTLQKILLEQLPKGCVKLGKRLKHIEQSHEAIQLAFEDGTNHLAEIVIGADGIHSVVKASIFGQRDLRDAGQLCWRGITDFELPAKYQHELFELWGKGERFGFVSIGKGKVYWYALRNDKKGNPLKKMFDGFDPIVKTIIHSTPEEQILENQIADFKPIPHWSNGRVCLLGDAAHATTPNLGQGACQAVESAWVFSVAMEKNHPDFSKAFQEFEQVRKPKARKVVNTSWQLGKMAHWKNPLAVAFRNGIMRLTPPSIGKKQSAFLFDVPMMD